MKPNKKILFVLIFTFGLIYILSFFFTDKRQTLTSKVSEKILFEKKTTKTNAIKSQIPIPQPSQTDEVWTSWFEKQSDQISQLVEDPIETQKQIQNIAESIPKDRIKWLKKLAINDKINTDQRLLAIEYLSLNPENETIDAMIDIILLPTNNNLTPALKTEENLLKAAAIEGLASKKNDSQKITNKLKLIEKKVEDKFLIDRIERSLWYLKGAAEKPEEQDTKALKELLGEPTK
jgi:hypothetical protein